MARKSILTALFTLICGISILTSLSAQPYDLAISPGEDTVISGTSIADHQIVARATGGGSWSLIANGLTAALPPESEIDALSFLSPTDVYFSLDCDALVGGTIYADEDIIYWNGSVFALQWDGSANGLAAELDVDALEVLSASPYTMLFSLNSDALLTVSGVGNTAVADEDILNFTTGSGFLQMVFDGSANGIPAEADLDAMDRVSPTEWQISFDIPGVVGALSFDDADLVSWNPTTFQFSPAPSFVAAGQGVAPEVDLGANESSNLFTPAVLNDAYFSSDNLPADIPALYGIPFSATLVNTGNTNWTQAGNYVLQILSDPCGLASVISIPLDPAAFVAPGDSYVFSTLLDVPAGPGACTLSLRMSQTGGAGQFGTNLILNPNIVAPVNNAVVVSNNIFSTMAPNQGLYFTVTMRNTGNTAWYPGSNHSLAVIGSPCMIPSSNRFSLNNNTIVMPGQTHAFLVHITAPGSLGLCNVQFQMIEELVQFFGGVLSKNVNIANPSNATEIWEIFE